MDGKGNKKLGRFRRQKGMFFFYVFIFFFIGGYLLFFTSRGWMSTQSLAKKQTELHQDIEWENRKIKIIRWEYSKEQHMMEVELDITNTKYDGIDKYQYSAMETNAGYLKVEPVIEESDWVIVQIKELPQKWAEVSFRVELPREEGETGEKLRLYTNSNKVAEVTSIETKDRTGYLVNRYEGEILAYEQEIDVAAGEITELIEKNRNIATEIKNLEQKKKHQTEEEIENTDILIMDASAERTATEEEIISLQEEIEEYKERIRNIEEQIEEIRKENGNE